MGWLACHGSYEQPKGSPKKLIQAVVDLFLDEEHEPPPELTLALACRSWGVLPDSGGYLDQDAGLMSRMNTYLNVYGAVSKWHNYTGDKIHLIPEHDRKILRTLMDEGIPFNG